MEYCKACGFEYKQMELEDGVFLAVAEARCRYASPARFDEEVVIRTWVEEANPRMVRFAYEMRLSADGRKLATGETKHIFLGRDLRPCRMPPQYREKFAMAHARERRSARGSRLSPVNADLSWPESPRPSPCRRRTTITSGSPAASPVRCAT